jgi:hypothetical protein
MWLVGLEKTDRLNLETATRELCEREQELRAGMKDKPKLCPNFINKKFNIEAVFPLT